MPIGHDRPDACCLIAPWYWHRAGGYAARLGTLRIPDPRSLPKSRSGLKWRAPKLRGMKRGPSTYGFGGAVSYACGNQTGISNPKSSLEVNGHPDFFKLGKVVRRAVPWASARYPTTEWGTNESATVQRRHPTGLLPWLWHAVGYAAVEHLLEPGPMAEIREMTHREYKRALHGLVGSGNGFRNNPIL